MVIVQPCAKIARDISLFAAACPGEDVVILDLQWVLLESVGQHQLIGSDDFAHNALYFRANF